MRALDEYVQGGEVELFRGVSSREYASQLRSGELYVGHGKLGGGASMLLAERTLKAMLLSLLRTPAA